MSNRRDLFPPIEPYRSGYLALDARHRMYWEEAANPRGPPTAVKWVANRTATAHL